MRREPTALRRLLADLNLANSARRKGTPAPVHIAGKKRASKHVTLVTGLETFGIDPKSQSYICHLAHSYPDIHIACLGFADDLKRLCASSTGGQSLMLPAGSCSAKWLTCRTSGRSIASHFSVSKGYAVGSSRSG